jgi:hypothetical protein
MLATLDTPTHALAVCSRPAEPYLVTSVASVSTVPPSRDAWRRVVRALEPIRRLQDDWDGLGAAAPSAELVESAIQLTNCLEWADYPTPTTVAPTPAGTILFTWDGPVYLELEVTSPYRAEWMYIDETGAATHGQFPSIAPQ